MPELFGWPLTQKNKRSYTSHKIWEIAYIIPLKWVILPMILHWKFNFLHATKQLFMLPKKLTLELNSWKVQIFAISYFLCKLNNSLMEENCLCKFINCFAYKWNVMFQSLWYSFILKIWVDWDWSFAWMKLSSNIWYLEKLQWFWLSCIKVICGSFVMKILRYIKFIMDR